MRACECGDPGCPVHPGVERCGQRAKWVLERIDFAGERLWACAGCATDMLDSGVFA